MVRLTSFSDPENETLWCSFHGLDFFCALTFGNRSLAGRYPSGQRGQTVNLLPYGFQGSNPCLPTKLSRLNP